MDKNGTKEFIIIIYPRHHAHDNKTKNKEIYPF